MFIRSVAGRMFILVLLLVPACGPDNSPADPEPTPVAAGFFDRAPSAGLTFRNRTGKVEDKDYIVEAKAGGTLALDYDGDGDVDICVVDGNRYELGPEGEVVSKTVDPEARNRLLRNDGGWKFTDVTEEAGLGDRSYGIGGTVGDYDNDGDPDVYVCNWGANRLYRNEGDGTFTDVTAGAGVAGGAEAEDYFSTGATFFDADDDGDLDLYVVNYNYMGEFIEATRGRGRLAKWRGMMIFAGPYGIRPAADRFYRNDGDGTFADVTETVLVDQAPRYGFTPVVSDFDRDGDLDVYVSNDLCDNSLWINDGTGVFHDRGLESGVAMSGNSVKQASMGSDSADFDQDGWPDIFLTHYSHDTNTLYRNVSRETKAGWLHFEDLTAQAGLGAGDFFKVCWGTKFQDFDLDGHLDIFLVAGHVYQEIDRVAEEVGTTYRQSPSLWRNGGPPGWRFEDVSDRGGPGLETKKCGRGACFADFDDDGDVDVYIATLNDVPILLENRMPREGNFLMIRLVGRSRDRDAIGTRVTVEAGGGRIRQVQEMRRTASFIGSNDPRLHWGVGRNERIDRLTIEWRGGETQVVTGLEANHLYRVVEGETPKRVW